MDLLALQVSENITVPGPKTGDGGVSVHQQDSRQQPLPVQCEKQATAPSAVVCGFVWRSMIFYRKLGEKTFRVLRRGACRTLSTSKGRKPVPYTRSWALAGKPVLYARSWVLGRGPKLRALSHA